MGRKRWFLIGAAAIAFAIAIVGGAIGRGTFGSSIIVFAIAFWIGLPLLVVTGALWAWTRARRRAGKRADAQAWVTAVGMAGVLLLVGVAGSPFVGIAVGKFDVASAKRFGEEMLPLLERYCDAHGVYPDSLSDITDLSRAPRLVRAGDLTYQHYWRGFEFELVDKRGFGFAGWNLSSPDREWRYWED